MSEGKPIETQDRPNPSRRERDPQARKRVLAMILGIVLLFLFAALLLWIVAWKTHLSGLSGARGNSPGVLANVRSRAAASALARQI